MSSSTFEFPPVFGLLLQASWQAGLLVLVVLGIQRILGQRLTPAWRHALWWVVLGRLVIPVTPPSSWSLFNLIDFPPHQHRSPPASLTSARSWEPTVDDALSVSTMASFQPDTPRAVDRESTSSPESHWASPALSVGSALTVLWAVVALSLLSRIAVQNLRFSRRVRETMQPVGPAFLTVLDECRSRMGIQGRIELLQGGAVRVPAVFGMYRPRILLPQQLARTCRPEQLRHILLHELAHLRRRDQLVHGLTRVLQALHWFNPLLVWGFRHLRADREIATDALALEIAGEHESRAYGHTIIQLLQQWVTHPAPPTTVGILEDGASLERRIRAIAAYRRPSRWAPLASLLVVGLAAASWTSAQTEGAPQPASLPPAVAVEATEKHLQESTHHLESADVDSAHGTVEAALASGPEGDRAHRPLLSGTNQADPFGRPESNPGERQRMLALLETIRIPEVGFDRLTLEQVVRQLTDLARARDPAGKGINFLINSYLDAVQTTDIRAGIGPDNGTTNQPASMSPPSLNDVLVRMDPPLRDVRLLDALRALTLSASVPIQFTVEDYAVVFAHKPPGQANLVTRVLRTNPERFSTRLESTLRILGRTNGVASAEVPGPAIAVQGRIQQFLEALGVSLVPPNAVLFNANLGLLMVRATRDEVELVENAIEVLNGEILAAEAEQPAPAGITTSEVTANVTNFGRSTPTETIPVETLTLYRGVLAHIDKLIQRENAFLESHTPESTFVIAVRQSIANAHRRRQRLEEENPGIATYSTGTVPVGRPGDLMNPPVDADLLKEYAEAVTKLAELLERHRTDGPPMVAARARVEELRARIRAEANSTNHTSAIQLPAPSSSGPSQPDILFLSPKNVWTINAQPFHPATLESRLRQAFAQRQGAMARLQVLSEATVRWSDVAEVLETAKKVGFTNVSVSAIGAPDGRSSQ